MQQQPTAPDVLAEAARLDPPRTPYLVRADGSEALAAPTEGDGSDARVKRARWLAHVGYFLQCFGFLGGSGSLIGTLLAHLGKRRARGTWLESHFNWQTETFWMSVVYWILLIVVGVVASEVIGIDRRLVLILLQIVMGGWYLGRVAKGWTRLWYGEAMDDEK